MLSTCAGVGTKVQAIADTSIVDGGWWDPSGFWIGLHTLLDPVRLPYFNAILADHPHRRVLDVGSGGGFVAAGLDGGAGVVAVDRSRDALEDAMSAGVSPVAAADAAHLPFGDGSFDAVICSEVLEHVSDPASAVSEAARVSAPGGLFLFSTPARTHLSRFLLIDVAQRWRVTSVLPPALHDWSRFLTRRDLTGLLADNGFVVRRLSGIGIAPSRLPAALAALSLLKLGRIGYAEAGRRITLTTTRSTQVAMIGYAERTR